MNRPRKKHRGLPKRVYKKHGAYYFFAPEPKRNPWSGEMKRWIRLSAICDGEALMFARLGEVLQSRKLVDGSMPNLCEDWKAGKLHRYSEEVQKEYRRMADVIATAFEDYLITQVTTKDCADFLRENFHDKANAANKYANVMRKMFRMAISEKGVRQDNPCDQLDLSDYRMKRREALPAHDAIAAIRNAALLGLDGLPTESGPMFQCILDMSYLIWQRAIDVRTLLESQVSENAIRFKPSKTAHTSGKVLDVGITPQMAAIIQRARDIKRKYGITSPYLFPTQKGSAYTKSGLNSMWRRAKARAGVTDDVQFKDLRALGATDAARTGTARKDIQTRLAHTTAKTTEIYIKEAIPELSTIDLRLPW